MLMIFFIFSNNEIETNYLNVKLSSEFKIKNLGQARKCLGMRISIDKSKNVITLDQYEYINQLLIKFTMINYNGINTPIKTNVNLVKSKNGDNRFPYQQLIGSLM